MNPDHSQVRPVEEASEHPPGVSTASGGFITRAQILALVLGAMLVAGFTSYHIARSYRNELDYWLDRQSAMAEDRARAVSEWLQERQADAEVVASFPSVEDLVTSSQGSGLHRESGQEVPRHVSQFLDRFMKVYGYQGIFVLDADGKIVSKSSGSPNLDPSAQAAIETSASQGKLRIETTGVSPQDSVLTFSAPVFSKARTVRGNVAPALRRVAGVVVMQIPGSRNIHGILTAPLVPTRSGETFLVRLEGDEILFLTPLRYRASSLPYLRRALAGEGLAARRALLEGDWAGEEIDYRGERVIAATRRIPLTGWGLVRKVDRNEALERFYQSAIVEGLAGLLVLLAYGAFLRSYWRGQVARSLESRIEQQQQVLKVSEYAQEIVDNVPAGLLVLSSDMRVLSANRYFLEFSRLHSEEVKGRRLDEVIQAEGPPYRVEGLSDRGLPTQSVLLNVSVAGRLERFPARITITSIAHPEGQARLLAVFEDQTESERLRTAAEASERRLRDLVQSVDAIVWEADAATLRMTFVSRRAEKILGYRAEDWVSAPDFWETHIDPADRDRVAARVRAAASRGEDYELEYRMRSADGRIVWLRDKVRAVKDAAGHPLQLRGVMLDVTDEKRAEEERARLSLAVEQAAEAILMTDPEGTISYVNPAFERVTGYSRSEVIGQNPRLLHSGKHDRVFYETLWATLRRGEVWSGRFTNRRKDGTLYEAEAVISPVRDVAGRVVNYVAVQRDVTRERQLEEQVRQSQKIEAVGRLAGGVAHDFNNLLTIIGGYCDLMLERLDPEDPSRGNVAEIKKAADRAASLTRQLLAFSRRQVLAPQVLDLNAVVANVHKMLRRLIGEDIDLVMKPAPDLGRVRVDPGQIEQVLLNLVVNARDAMPQGGKITIETANVELDQSYTGGHFVLTEGPYVMLAVSDTGCGMDAETQSHIFEPFFTTKEQGKGTGLGLAMVYGIVKQSGGYIWVYSEVGRGTTFKIYLPLVGESPAPERQIRGFQKHVGGAETVLLVEDETPVRAFVRGILESAGYTVLEAPNGEEALEISRKHNERIHLLVTDVVMPRMSGPELAQQLAPLRREMRVLYMSGYADDAIVHHGVSDSSAAFLQKPFTPDSLTRKIREVLDAG
jgi:PAS domain S-box-containing protein